MCGICGFIGAGEPGDLAGMTRAIQHRGPDSAGEWSDPARRIFLGHRRLSVIDHVNGRQPMTTLDGDHIVVFNGEIYNHIELRAELEALGHRFMSDHSDTEVLLHGFRQWGKSLPTRLNGMWAFAIYDVHHRMIFASRDRFGKKPFFFTTIHGGFAFASEVESLRAHRQIGPRLELSRVALKKYFGYGYIPAPHSIWKGIQKLPAGHSLWVFDQEPAAVKTERYWQFRLEPEPIGSRRAFKNKVEELESVLKRAVSRRLVADVPVGVFLSGGIDSSAITALAARQSPPGRVSTFCVGFEEPSFDESKFARAVAKHCKTTHFEEQLSIEAGRDMLPDIIRKLDEPMGDSSVLPTALLAYFARTHVTVALGGDGGDELFAGYDPFRALRTAERVRRMPPKRMHEAVISLVAKLPVSHRNMSFDFKAKRFLRGLASVPALQVPTWMGPLSIAELSELFDEPIDEEELYSEAIEAWDRNPQANEVDRVLQFYTELYLQDDILTKVDRASMQVALEVRAPFLDIEVVDLVRKIPSEWKFRHGETKYILKKAMQPLLPESIIYRKKKGFGMPVGLWFKRGVLKLSDPPLNPIFSKSRLMQHQAGERDDRAFLWNMWLLQEWLKSRR